jgi:hypothetical protein
MKDLFLFSADADTQAFLGAVLARSSALGTKPINIELDRHPQRDAGMVQSGPELLRMRKGEARYAVMVLDFHGSGADTRSNRSNPVALQLELQDRLDRATWRSNSLVVVLEPELEHWLWYARVALAKHWELSRAQVDDLILEWSNNAGLKPDEAVAKHPKELFEYAMRNRLKRTISPRDFQCIGAVAGIRSLELSPAFARLVQQLRAWFPADGRAA